MSKNKTVNFSIKSGSRYGPFVEKCKKKGFLPTIVYIIRRLIRHDSESIRRSLNKFANLSERQERPLRYGAQNIFVTLSGVELPKSVMNFISFVPKEQFINRFNELLFLVVEDRLFGESQEINNDGKNLSE